MERTPESRCVMKRENRRSPPRKCRSSMFAGLISEANPAQAAFCGPIKAWWPKRSGSPMPGKDGRSGRKNWASWMRPPVRSSLGWKRRLGMERSVSRVGTTGYVLRLLHPGQTHQFHQQQGLRAKTDRLDAMTIARVLLSGEARAGYVPSERIA